jgi:hypothetical protein
MSRHHMLPPIVYVPQPKPKKIESRKSRIQVRSAGGIEDTGETEEACQPAGPDQPAPATSTLLAPNFSFIEGSEKKPPSTTGLLSEDTLRALPQAQELK